VELTDNSSMINHAITFYKKLFGGEPRSNTRLGEQFWEENGKITSDEKLLGIGRKARC
jgi:hypothetical protein